MSITQTIWSDLDPTLVADPQANLKLDLNIEAVKGSIDNIIRTSPGERVFLPQFALGLKNLVFEPITNRLLDNFSDQIKSKVEVWDPRVSVVGVDYKLDPDNNLVSITVRFNIQGVVQTLSTTTTVVH
jgi:phage baseplate assembly protein W